MVLHTQDEMDPFDAQKILDKMLQDDIDPFSKGIVVHPFESFDLLMSQEFHGSACHLLGPDIIEDGAAEVSGLHSLFDLSKDFLLGTFGFFLRLRLLSGPWPR